ncbi:organic cation transporter protein [Patella vulgata]|uniref:organic cation transporter protein n=1 Tax=Patella vulgata TaxID=6465 RepID=UPI0024A8B512|nr:organic cation transporter protein [Patella vulgata]XP_050415522.2 organic cation transporter protein [Patella vulgata]XP_050415523.2 organic cation transporter protein [Patella vulgata]XP_050415524.2 organic cation transporter protein [Patella vulgata]
MKFDDILHHVGEFGPYQRRLYFLVCLPAITIAFHGMMPIFILDIPDYRCAIPGLKNDSYGSGGIWHQELLNDSIPYKDGKLSQCLVYDNTTGHHDANSSVKQCDQWVYDESVYENTAVTQLNLVCGKEIDRSHLNMINMAGNLVGSLGFGLLSDILGRKKVMMINIIIHITAGIGTAFITDFTGLAILRFMDGTSNSGLFLMVFGIGMELVGPSKRTFCGIVIDFFWILGLFGLGGLAYWLRDWRHLTLACSIPAVVFLSYGWLVPESPRWLLSRGRNDEAEAIIKKVAESNKRVVPSNMFGDDTLDEGPKSKLSEMFTTPRLVITSVILFYNWFVVNLVYYGLSLNIGNLSGDIYLNYTLSNIAECVAYIGCILLLDKVGRKFLLTTCFIVGGLGCVSILFPVIYGSSSQAWITIMITMIGRLGCSGSYAIMFVYSAEIFPTVVRSSGMGVCAVFSRIGGVVAPYIADLGLLTGGDLKTALPLLVFGVTSLLAGILTLVLPETLNKQLPETIDDAKILTKGGISCGRKKHYEMNDKHQHKNSGLDNYGYLEK